ncbi:hypothetical protein J8273_6954 [Carpediemonas membranifera]|uniref:Uncharacterized protein n=1 Tax=Carpediemonas membranifera TaxID=201153 RepID=A0A8J6DXP4_9EUKA|nr:hypothetical protein J8273_6954 [Carpediemonas membranifera]|eukprot:KAG9390714.1 hypothetical protein J8273_6954 [Carpediemonas membranifera]
MYPGPHRIQRSQMQHPIRQSTARPVAPARARSPGPARQSVSANSNKETIVQSIRQITQAFVAQDLQNAVALVSKMALLTMRTRTPADLLLLRASAFYLMKRYESCLIDCDLVIKEQPTNVFALKLHADCLISLGLPQGALPFLLRITDNKTPPVPETVETDTTILLRCLALILGWAVTSRTGLRPPAARGSTSRPGTRQGMRPRSGPGHGRDDSGGELLDVPDDSDSLLTLSDTLLDGMAVDITGSAAYKIKQIQDALEAGFESDFASDATGEGSSLGDDSPRNLGDVTPASAARRAPFGSTEGTARPNTGTRKVKRRARTAPRKNEFVGASEIRRANKQAARLKSARHADRAEREAGWRHTVEGMNLDGPESRLNYSYGYGQTPSHDMGDDPPMRSQSQMGRPRSRSRASASVRSRSVLGTRRKSVSRGGRARTPETQTAVSHNQPISVIYGSRLAPEDDCPMVEAGAKGPKAWDIKDSSIVGQETARLVSPPVRAPAVPRELGPDAEATPTPSRNKTPPRPLTRVDQPGCETPPASGNAPVPRLRPTVRAHSAPHKRPVSAQTALAIHKKVAEWVSGKNTANDGSVTSLRAAVRSVTPPPVDPNPITPYRRAVRSEVTAMVEAKEAIKSQRPPSAGAMGRPMSGARFTAVQAIKAGKKQRRPKSVGARPRSRLRMSDVNVGFDDDIM